MIQMWDINIISHFIPIHLSYITNLPGKSNARVPIVFTPIYPIRLTATEYNLSKAKVKTNHSLTASWTETANFHSVFPPLN